MPPELIAPTSVRLPAKLKGRLLEQSRKRRQPLSMLIVFVLEQWLMQQDITQTMREASSDRLGKER